VIQVSDLRMRYGTHDVLRGVNLCLQRGETLALLGPNGAGKSTTIEILEGFRAASSGEVRVLGEDPLHGDRAWRARVGIVLQPGGITASGASISSYNTKDRSTAPTAPPTRRDHGRRKHSSTRSG
jgi:ABC-type multidrug transport system ATPase subunit